MKVVYAITSDGADAYAAMTRISAVSLRLNNPGVEIILACDQQSAGLLARAQSPLLKEIDRLVTCQTPDGDASFRNRFVKTSLRQRIDGAFLFLDSDTLIRADVSALFATEEDLAGARNHSRSDVREQVYVQDSETLIHMGWKVRDDCYLNGGVIFYNDTQLAHRFGELWHTNWLASSSALNRYRDQPALNAAVFSSGVNLKLLGNEYNAQIKASTGVSQGAKIIHYYSSIETPAIYAFDVLVSELLAGKKLTHRQVRGLIRRHHLWRRDWWIDDLYVNTFAHKSAPDEVDLMWLVGNRQEAWRIRWEEQLSKAASPRSAALNIIKAALGKGVL